MIEATPPAAPMMSSVLPFGALPGTKPSLSKSIARGVMPVSRGSAACDAR